MRSIITIVLLLALTSCAASAQLGNSVFLYDFCGNVWEVGDFGRTGSTAFSVGQVNNIASFLTRQPGCTWTYYMSDLVAQSAVRNGSVWTVCYTGGQIEIHEDCTNNPPFDYGSTPPPNPTSPSTFIDGDLILHGTLSNFCVTIDINTGIGSFTCDATFDGGSQLDSLPDAAAVTMSTSFNRDHAPGYQHYTCGEVDVMVPTPALPTTWGAVKALYR